MTEPQTPKTPKRRTGAQTKALAGLVAIMLAAAIVALVFVTNGSGSSNKQAGGQPSDVGRNSADSATPTSSAVPSVRPSSSATAPTTSSTSTPATSPAASSGATSSSAAPTATSSTSGGSSQQKSITYTVKKGDNLTVIAAWFHEHGYGRLYELNRHVIGDNPNLIFPGEKITIAGGKMTTS